MPNSSTNTPTLSPSLLRVSSLMPKKSSSPTISSDGCPITRPLVEKATNTHLQGRKRRNMEQSMDELEKSNPDGNSSTTRLNPGPAGNKWSQIGGNRLSMFHGRSSVLPGENKPLDMSTGRVTTQPARPWRQPRQGAIANEDSNQLEKPCTQTPYETRKPKVPVQTPRRGSRVTSAEIDSSTSSKSHTVAPHSAPPSQQIWAIDVYNSEITPTRRGGVLSDSKNSEPARDTQPESFRTSIWQAGQASSFTAPVAPTGKGVANTLETRIFDQDLGLDFQETQSSVGDDMLHANSRSRSASHGLAAWDSFSLGFDYDLFDGVDDPFTSEVPAARSPIEVHKGPPFHQALNNNSDIQMRDEAFTTPIRNMGHSFANWDTPQTCPLNDMLDSSCYSSNSRMPSRIEDLPGLQLSSPLSQRDIPSSPAGLPRTPTRSVSCQCDKIMRCKDVAQERDFQTPIRDMSASHYEMIGSTSPGEEMEFRTHLDDERKGMGSDLMAL
jgi:hypothetical protein